jgi:hypothetical protein
VSDMIMGSCRAGALSVILVASLARPMKAMHILAMKIIGGSTAVIAFLACT